MTKVLVLYYSAYGHTEAMANAVAEGARGAGAEVDIKRVPELVPEEIARKAHATRGAKLPKLRKSSFADRALEIAKHRDTILQRLTGPEMTARPDSVV